MTLLRKNKNLIDSLNIVTDVILTFAAYWLSMFFRFEVLNGQRGENMLGGVYLAVALGYSAAIVFAYYCAGLYGGQRFRLPGNGMFAVLGIDVIGVLSLMAVFYFFRLGEFPRLAVVLFWAFSGLLICGKHELGHLLLRAYQKGEPQRRVLVVGSGRLARQYLEDAAAEAQPDIRLMGYIGAEEASLPASCLGGYEALETVLESDPPDELVVALDPADVGQMRAVLEAADKEGLHTTLIPFYNDYMPAHPTIDVVGRSKLIDLRATPLDNIGWAVVKRAMDIVGALLLIIVSSPLMLVTAVGVKLSSPGPVLFRQERVGKDRRPFTMYKFRSMRVTDSENTAWTTDTDPRKTRFGSFIRKFSLDEFPQFFNVLKGDMSLVGPRPEIPYHVRHFKEEVPLYLVRQQVRPGITGWAQVNGLRGDTSIEARVKYDIWYIENWSLGLDIRILFKTVFGGMVNAEQLDAPGKGANDG